MRIYKIGETVYLLHTVFHQLLGTVLQLSETDRRWRFKNWKMYAKLVVGSGNWEWEREWRKFTPGKRHILCIRTMASWKVGPSDNQTWEPMPLYFYWVAYISLQPKSEHSSATLDGNGYFGESNVYTYLLWIHVMYVRRWKEICKFLRSRPCGEMSVYFYFFSNSNCNCNKKHSFFPLFRREPKKRSPFHWPLAHFRSNLFKRMTRTTVVACELSPGRAHSLQFHHYWKSFQSWRSEHGKKIRSPSHFHRTCNNLCDMVPKLNSIMPTTNNVWDINLPLSPAAILCHPIEVISFENRGSVADWSDVHHRTYEHGGHISHVPHIYIYIAGRERAFCSSGAG